MHNYAPTATAPTTCPVVDDGDPPTAANLAAGNKANADAIAWEELKKAPKASPAFTGTVDLTAPVIKYPMPFEPADAATINVDASTPYSSVILPNPATNRIVVLKTTGLVGTLVAGQVLELSMPPGLADGLYFSVKRESGTVIFEFHGFTVTEVGGDVQGTAMVKVLFDGINWRGLGAGGYIVKGAGW